MVSPTLSGCVAFGIALCFSVGQVRSECSWTSPTNMLYNFTDLVLPAGQDYIIPGSGPDEQRGFKYYFNFCNGVATHPANPVGGCNSSDAACQYDPSGGTPLYYSLGKVNMPIWVEHTNHVSVTYLGGSTVLSPVPREVQVNLICSGDGENKFGPAEQDSHVRQSFYVYNITLKDACGKPAPPPPTPPPTPPGPSMPRTCQEVLYEHPSAVDGEYMLQCPPAKAQKVYCNGMQSGDPKEYLTVEKMDNVAEFQCGAICRSYNAMNTKIVTHYLKVRYNPCLRLIDVTDRLFSESTGKITNANHTVLTTVPFAVAASCEGVVADGVSHANLGDTGLAFDTFWRPSGRDAIGSAHMPFNNTQVTIEGSGDCGQNAPVGFLVSPTTYTNVAHHKPQWVLKLKAAAPTPPTPPTPPPSPPPSPPSPPPTPPPSPPNPSLVWRLGSPNLSCRQVCTEMSANCVENDWPTTQAAFLAIVRTLPGGTCPQVVEGNYPANPQRGRNGGECYWDGSGGGAARCDLYPQSTHERFCPCEAKSPPTPPPTPPTPPPNTSITWKFGLPGLTCTSVCSETISSCVENHWPATEAAFLAMLRMFPANTCPQVVAGNDATNPQRGGSGECYWEGGVGGQNRCGLFTASTHQRFCPCKANPPPMPPPTPPPTPPPNPSLAWKLGSPGLSCERVCSATSSVCVDSMMYWPTTEAAFLAIVRTLPTGTCPHVVAGNYPTNPQRGNNGECYWEGVGDGAARCALVPTSTHQRFCPCMLRERARNINRQPIVTME